MARLRRWAASGTGEGCNSTWNSASGFSCFRATYLLDTLRGGAVEKPIDTHLFCSQICQKIGNLLTGFGLG